MSSCKCLYCSRTFATPYALKRHISDKHRFEFNEDEESTKIVEESGLWNEDSTINYSEVIII